MFPFPPNLKAKIVHLCESSHSSLELCDSGQDLLSLLLAERNARTTPETFRNDDFGGGQNNVVGLQDTHVTLINTGLWRDS